MALFDFINFSKKKPDAAVVTKYIQLEQQLQRVRSDAQKFQIAVQAAESPLYPNRFLLCQVYQNLVLDAQVEAGMLQRKSRVLSQKFKVTKNGEVDYEKTKLINQKWFYDFSNYALDSIFWGFSLVQFSDVVNDKFSEVTLVPRIYVVPEKSLVRPNTATVTEGVNFTELPYSNWCVGIGDKKDLGILMKLAPYVIWKKNAMFAWSEFAEIFGSPIRLGKTDVRDETTRKNMENMLKNMSVATWAVMDLNDDIQLEQASSTDAFNVFDKLVDRCNSEITKIILGQTGTTDEKAYSGSSNVHKGIADILAKQDQQKMQFWVNDQLFPMLNRLGFGLEGYEFEFDMSESLSLVDQAKIDVSLMPYFKLSSEYIESKYGVEIEDEPMGVMEEEVGGSEAESGMSEGESENGMESESSIENKLKNLYR